jgi:hypothetical protein
MAPAGFEPVIPAAKQPQIYVTDTTVAMMGLDMVQHSRNMYLSVNFNEGGKLLVSTCAVRSIVTSAAETLHT